MATLKTMKKEDRDWPEQTITLVDYDIIEYFYACELNDILDDDDLCKLIDSNGFYKTCVCEAFGMGEITLTCKGKDMTWYGPPVGVPTNFETFVLRGGGMVGVNHKNYEQHNINDIQKYRK